MWMGEIELSDGTALHGYKHVATRRYLHLDEDGRAFGYGSKGRYGQIAAATAVAQAVAGWEDIMPEPSEGDVSALRGAVQRLRAA
jgi:hypothetical protein